MTGYGRGQLEEGGFRVLVEIRSVNHRFLDLKLRGMGLDPVTEDGVQRLVKEKVHRGSVTVTVRLEEKEQGGHVVHVNQEAARRAYAELDELRKVLNIEEAISLSLVCRQPGVLVAPVSTDLSVLARQSIFASTRVAIKELVGMRALEGARLKEDIETRIGVLSALIVKLRSLVQHSPEEAQRRLRERIQRLLDSSNVQVDDARIAQEVAIWAERLDVTEELVRLDSHLAQISEILTYEKPVGRRLDFLVQELGREFNTLTSKSQSAEVARVVVEAKAEMEKIREQVQNLE